MKSIFTPYIYTLFFGLSFIGLYGQKFELKVTAKDTVNTEILQAISFHEFHKTKDSIFAEIASISLKLSKLGFIDNQILNTQLKDSIYNTLFFLGANSKSISIKYDATLIPEIILNQLNETYDDSYIYTELKNVPKLLNNIIAELDNQGYSFSRVSLKNITKTAEKLQAELNIQISTQRTIDHIIVKGYTDFPKSYLNHYLKLKKGVVFNESKISDLSNGIASIPFASETRSPEVLFEKDSTSIYLYLQKTKINRFDGLIGFASNDQGKIKFNGYLDLYLSNLFNKGESFSMQWKSNSEDRKTFNVSLITPFIFNSPFSFGASLNIHKQDSTFLNTKGNFDLYYLLKSNHQILANLRTETSNEISDNNLSVEDFKTIFYGTSYIYRKPDPIRPFQDKAHVHITGLWGNRATISDKVSQAQSKYQLTASYIWTLNKNNSFFFKNQSALLLSDNYYLNELYRIGGISTIRGFKEETIYSSGYSIANFEYRYHINLTSKFYSITDVGYIQNKMIDTYSTIYGFGLGYSYGTKNGLIDISYALGKQNNIPIEFKNATFHIKYIKVF